VRIRDEREAVGLKTSGDRTRVTGLLTQTPGGGQEETLEAELVVDASGRGSRTPQWLEALGYPRVEETRIHVNVGYASRLYRKPPDFEPGWRSLAISPELPKERRLGIIQGIEDNRWLVLVGGWLGEAPASADDAAFLEFARGLAQPHLYEAIKNAEPLGPIHLYRFAHNQRRHYERMPRFPEGLAVVGDAFCSFNPIYGQGMSTGALQAEALGECLRSGARGAANRYRQRAGQLLEGPWLMATAGDLGFPEVEGKRPPGFGLMNWYGNRFQQLVGYDEEALRTFVRVQHMIESPAAMFSPRMVLKVLTVRPDKAAQTPGPQPLAASTPRAA
jgi:2-polyprenyl-6-methoxyphenol hydroxylase-like FAD-dependent oxidoreductase